MARFSLHSTVLPALTDALRIGEHVRAALLRRSDGAALFVGRDPDGSPMEGHSHAFFLPSDEDDDGRLDHVTLYAAAGFDEAALKGLARLRELTRSEGLPPLRVVLEGLGTPESYGRHSPILARARVWVSRTPYILTRHPKTYRDGRPKLRADGRQVDGPEDQLLRELAVRGLPEPEGIERVSATMARGRPVRWLHFTRHRTRGGRGAHWNTMPFGFRIVFPEEVSGPLAFGYGAHYGLGQFVAEGAFDGAGVDRRSTACSDAR